MAEKDPRRIWLVTHQGIPQGFTWALYRDPSEFDVNDDRIPARARQRLASGELLESQVRSWASALDEAQEADPDWDATPSEWRRVPRLLRPGVLEHTTPSVAGRELHAAGCRFSLDSRGKPKGRGEPEAPEATITDEAELARALERVSSATGLEAIEVNGTIRRPR